MSDENPRPQMSSEHEPLAPETKVLPTTYLDDPSQLPPNVRLVGQDEYGNYIYEEVPGSAGAADTSTAGFAGGSYGGGVVYPAPPQATTPPSAPEPQKESSNPVVIALTVVLVVLLVSMAVLLAMVFIPKAPLNHVVSASTTTTEVTETATSPEDSADADDTDSTAEEEDDEFADLVVRLPRGFTLSDPIDTGEDTERGSSYRIVNPCATAGRGVACTSEDFAEAMMEAYVDNGGLDEDMHFYAESPLTGEEYPVACERQNGGKVLCVSGRDSSAAIMIDYD